MASARTAQLYEQRKALSGLNFGSKRRVLSPANNAIASIAKKTAQNELDVNVRKYNEGMIGNEEMRSFLSKMLTNPGLSDADKQEVQMQLNDFDSRIQKDQFETAFKSAPENSIAQVQAIQSLINYHSSRASGMAAGTPAQAQALQNAAVWQQKLADVNKNMATIQQRNLRYTKEQEINQLPTNSAERAYAKSQMYKALYEQAVSTGDTVDANKYASYYQQELTNAEELAVREDDRQNREVQAENKKTLTDAINTTINDYHDGKISGDQALLNLEEANKFAYELGDTAALNRLNGLSITINREIDKGVTYSSVNGLSMKSKGGTGSGTAEAYLNPDGSLTYGGGVAKSTPIGTRVGAPSTQSKNTSKKANLPAGVGGSGQEPKTLSQLDIEYKNDLTEANNALQNGVAELDGRQIPFTAEDYREAVLVIEKDRQLKLQNINKGLDQLSAQGITKIGKKKIEDLKKEYGTQYQQVTAKYNGIRTGNLVLTMGSKESTDEMGVKTSMPQLQFADKNKVKNMIDVGGIYQPVRNEKVYINPDASDAEIEKFNKSGIQIEEDEYGKYYSKQMLDVKDTAGNSITYENHPKYGFLPLAVGPKTGMLRQQMVKEADEAIKKNAEYKPKLMGHGELLNFDYKTPVGQTIPKPITPNTQDNVMGAVKSGLDTVGKAVAPVVEQAQKVIAPIAPPREAPLSDMPSSQINLNQPVRMPDLRTPELTPVQSAAKPIQQPRLTSPIQAPNALQTAAKQQGLKVSIPKETQAFQQAKNVTVQSNPQKQVADNIVNFAKGIGTKIKNLFKW